MSKYKSSIVKINITDATFKGSKSCEIEPSWINFFYGNNGTGKSTIARAIRNGNGLSWGDGKSPDDFNVLVYNREFISKELMFDDESPLMPSVVMLGEENIETQKLISSKQAEQAQLDIKVQVATTDRSEKQRKKGDRLLKFQKVCWSAAGRYYNTFGGRKGDFQSGEKCANRLRKTKPVEHDFQELVDLYKTATDENAKIYNVIAQLDISKLDSVETYPLLGRAIISTADNAYSRFWQTINATEWVKQGHDRFSQLADNECPYCRQGLPHDFEEQFAACFDSRYAEDCAKLAEYQQKYKNYINTFIDEVRRYLEYIPSQGFGDVQAYKTQLSLLETTLDYNNQQIAVKIEKPSETITLKSVKTYLEAINALIVETNELFEKNNAIVSHRENQQLDCMAKIWELLAYEVQDEIEKYLEDDKALEDEIEALRLTIEADQCSLNTLKIEVSQLSEKLGGSIETVGKINSFLEKSGFIGFRLREHERIPDKCEVVRNNGEVAKGLSEGERHFIAFLYFYHLVQGAWKKQDLPKGKIVVIDDPVSSMDSGVLYIVGSLVRNLIDDCFLDGQTHNIKQIFILTHNPYFHKDVSFYRIGDYKKVSFFEVKKSEENISTVVPCLEECEDENGAKSFSPVQNSYTALWNEYKDAKLPTTLLSVIRRIVEYHFIQLCSYSIEELRSRVFKHIGDDDNKRSIAGEMLRHIYEPTDSVHDMGDGIYFSADRDNDVYKEAFKGIFKAMEQNSHYMKMSGEANS